jgi:hypothetical protein
MSEYTDPPLVVASVAASVGEEESVVREVLSDLRFTIDLLVRMDVPVLMHPLYFGHTGHPVVAAIAARFTDNDWRSGAGLKVAGPDELARGLDLAPETVVDNPVAFRPQVVDELARLRGVDGDECEEEYWRLDEIVRAWRGYIDPRRYRVRPIGRERDFEDWLVENPDCLSEVWGSVEVVRRQQRLDSGSRIADLLCRIITSDAPVRAGDLLVVELKATPVHEGAVDQLAEYVRLVRKEVASGTQQVFGWLIADGARIGVRKRIEDEGLLYSPVALTGYCHHLRETSWPSDRADATDETDLTSHLPSALDVPVGD